MTTDTITLSRGTFDIIDVEVHQKSVRNIANEMVSR